ncbi:MAG: membrane protein insertion efficiency factor YidD [Patescibacteria group bacterium]
MKKISITIISIYQVFFSTLFKILLGNSKFCRFEETCSDYTKRAIKEKGFVKGIYLGLIRILKCQPYYKGPLYRQEII